MAEFVVEYIVTQAKFARVTANTREQAIKTIREYHAQVQNAEIEQETVMVTNVQQESE